MPKENKSIICEEGANKTSMIPADGICQNQFL